jgi:hypothetical protein
LSAALRGAGGDGGAALIGDSGLWWRVVVQAGGGSRVSIRGEGFCWLLGAKALLWPWSEPTTATLVSAAHLLGGVVVRGPTASSLALRGKPLFQVPGADGGGTPVSRSFLEASFWSGLGR